MTLCLARSFTRCAFTRRNLSEFKACLGSPTRPGPVRPQSTQADRPKVFFEHPSRPPSFSFFTDRPALYDFLIGLDQMMAMYKDALKRSESSAQKTRDQWRWMTQDKMSNWLGI